MFLLILFSPFNNEEDFVIHVIITAVCERQYEYLLGKYIVKIHCTDFAEAILDSHVHFVTFDEKCNICYTLYGPNKLS